MRNYTLSDDAEEDLRNIALYTLDMWGAEQLKEYQTALNEKFEQVGRGEALERPFSLKLPDVHVTKCRHHFIFYLTEENNQPIILAVFNERNDIVKRLLSRLS